LFDLYFNDIAEMNDCHENGASKVRNWLLTHIISAGSIRETEDKFAKLAARKGRTGPSTAIVSRIKVSTVCVAIPLPTDSFDVEPWTPLPDGSVQIALHFATKIERDIASEAIRGMYVKR
jgi:hypothetical protein